MNPASSGSTADTVLALQRRQAAKALGVSVETFDRHVRPHVAAILVGNVRLWRLADLDSWLRTRA